LSFLIGVDIGGTFTDAVAVDLSSARSAIAKARSTEEDLANGVWEALGQLASSFGITVEDLMSGTTKFAHGTTQTSNVMFTWTGAKTGLITTAGFADEILIMRARGRVAGLSLAERRHFRATEKPHKIVPRWLIEEVAERVDHHGNVLAPLTEAAAVQAVERLRDKGVTSIAISLLWAHQNPAHELMLEDVIRRDAPDVYVVSSHRVAPVSGEYERTATAAVDAYVGPTVTRYIERLSGQLKERGLREPLLILQASGGVVDAEHSIPVRTIESGPAAGMVAAQAISRELNMNRVIATDVGGTTFKVSLVVDGELTRARETVINQYAILVPMVDVVSIGSGGGSIAWVDETRLRVGPQSAGANPGPACYGWGGEEPTVTDADAVLGFLDPDHFLGGRLQLRRDLAEAAIKRTVADKLFDGDVVRAAAGIRTVVDSQMAGLVRKMTIERGYDPRDFTMIAYGGAGPLHAAGYGRALGVRRIVIPASATVYSAYGAAVSDIHHSLERSVVGTPSDVDLVESTYAQLEREGRELLRQQRVADADVSITRWADMRYERQLHDVRVRITDASEAAMCAAFEEQYTTLYGPEAALPGAGIRLLRLGVEAIGRMEKPVLKTLNDSEGSLAAAQRSVRPVFWPDEGRFWDTAVYDAARLPILTEIDGPALLDQPGTTVAVPPDAKVRIEPTGHIVVSL
jgi:N-methylhydantoinase A